MCPAAVTQMSFTRVDVVENFMFWLQVGVGWGGQKHSYMNAWEKEKNKEMKISLLPDYL